jgi:hypothetical protein
MTPHQPAEIATSSPQRERRLSRAEMAERIKGAPRFVEGRVSEDRLDAIVEAYGEITAVTTRSRAKRNLIAACYRIHVDTFLDLVRKRMNETGTETNLLAYLRSLPAIQVAPDERPVARASSVAGPPMGPPRGAPPESAGAGSPGEDLLPGLTYGAHDRPPFDPTSKRRYDRRPSNPDLHVDCLDFPAHQSFHWHSATGWVCDRCTGVEAP